MTDRQVFFVGPPDPVMRRAQAFISDYWFDADGEDEVRDHLRGNAEHHPRTVTAGLAALRTVLDDPSKGWTLTYLVESDANYGLAEYSEAAARAFLERFAAWAESALEAFRR